MFSNQNSPIEYLTAFAITFALGSVGTLVIQAYGRAKQNTTLKGYDKFKLLEVVKNE